MSSPQLLFQIYTFVAFFIVTDKRVPPYFGQF